ncbi:B-box zinc finger protein 20-like [Actinidia eriantha]|uniref:B-box zinc finger protein 20-like n=1 Tax=Actinidia eriantha TaxID=165200 RepID=UPI00258DAF41|nr:B-box zinc finger protein 20-like [Actinidia eriantha]
MKIQCDVCGKEEALVFCSADEAALCDGCDRQVHHANKLVGKHHRFSLLKPSSAKESPRCDICLDRRASLFCQEDRAILCRECDLPIHQANEHTLKHNRFLLTGARLSPYSYSSPPSPSHPASSSSNACDLTTHSEIKSSVSIEHFSNPSLCDKALPASTSTSTDCRDVDQCMNQENLVSTYSISEYLMETLPGWHADDFLDPSDSSNGFCKFLDHDVESNLCAFPSEDLGICVPQAPIQSSCIPLNGLLEGCEEAQEVMKSNRKWKQDGFTVLRISPPLKKFRQFW